jgi:hypothetical protein
MGPNDTNTTTAEGESARPQSDRAGKRVESPPPPPGVHFTSQHRKVWDYLCAVLREEGVPHKVGGIVLAVAVIDFVRWVKVELQLRDFETMNRGSFMVTTPNGHTQPHQLFYTAKALKEGLLKCLPDACLTVPSMLIAKSKMEDPDPQDDLFDALLDHAQSHPSALPV